MKCLTIWKRRWLISKTAPLPTVVKADGLALGKGVIIAQTKEQAQDAVRSMMADKVFGDKRRPCCSRRIL